MARPRTSDIRDFVVSSVGDHRSDLASLVAAKFSISRQAANRHLRQMVAEGLLSAAGQTRSRRYELAARKVSFSAPIRPGVEEDRLWRERVAPLLSAAPQNVRDICQYGFTEMVNNALSHSEGSTVSLEAEVTAEGIHLAVVDDGVGIFRKITKELGLSDEREAILELAKGKATTDPAGHTGEGVFFTSRAFDEFALVSGNLGYLHKRERDDWLLESPEQWSAGTGVDMRISLRFGGSIQGVFNEYATPDAYDFARTHVPVSLARYGRDQLVSRSQARRVLLRFNRFREVILDFHNVEMIGQAFADEVFRVFAEGNPQVKLSYTRANPSVERMIRRAQAGARGGRE